MTDAQKEIPLTGGRVTPDVVRVGDTVRRPATANSSFVRRLLEHLAVKGSDFSPKFLGTDERDHDILTFIEGDVPDDLAYFDESTLCEAASLIRRLHDLSSDLVTSQMEVDKSNEVICHNDLSPCNFVFRGERPVAIIDFDASAPGNRVDDLGYAAWLWLDIGSPEIGVIDQRRRLARFNGAYGVLRIDSVLEAMLERQALLASDGRNIGDAAIVTWANACYDWTRENRRNLRGG